MSDAYTYISTGRTGAKIAKIEAKLRQMEAQSFLSGGPSSSSNSSSTPGSGPSSSAHPSLPPKPAYVPPAASHQAQTSHSRPRMSSASTSTAATTAAPKREKPALPTLPLAAATFSSSRPPAPTTFPHARVGSPGSATASAYPLHSKKPASSLSGVRIVKKKG